MKSVIIAAAFAASAVAAPVEKRAATPTDVQILNYALTLEHLERQFYIEGLANYTQADFEKIGAGGLFYNNLKEISFDEDTHVSFLTKAVGKDAVAACSYDFGVNDAAGFLALAALLEGVGVSAYLGAAKDIVNKDYLTAAGAILTVEARHSAFFRSYQSPPQSPFPYPFEIPLGFDQVYTLAAQFITACPSTNPKLPVMAFPVLTVTSPTGEVPKNQTVTLKAAKSVDAKAAWFVTLLGPIAAPLTGSGDEYSIVVPMDAQAGQEYLVLTGDDQAPTDDNTVAGPAIIMVADNDYGVPVPMPTCVAGSGSSPAGSGAGSAATQIGDGQVQAGGAATQIGDGQVQAGAPATQIGDGQVQAGAPATQIGDGQVQAGAPATQIGDGQVQAGAPATQIGDGQVQAGAPATQIGDGQVQAGAPATQIGDGQVQAGAPATQIGDGQVQAGAPATQIGDGQVQAGAPATQIGDGQVQAGAPATQIGDGQVQAATPTAYATQIGDGQVQAGAPTAYATQIGDGQVQAGAPATQIGDGQVQAAAPTAYATQIGDGQVQAGTPATQINDGQVQAGAPATQIADGQVQAAKPT